MRKFQQKSNVYTHDDHDAHEVLHNKQAKQKWNENGERNTHQQELPSLDFQSLPRDDGRKRS
jgi:hypothetical protein